MTTITITDQQISCPALHVLAGTIYRTTPSGRLVPRVPEHDVDPDTGRCKHCHTTVILGLDLGVA